MVKIGADTKSAEQAVDKTLKALPGIRSKSALSILLRVKSGAIDNLSGSVTSGGVLRRRGIIIDLAKHVSAQFPIHQGNVYGWGLPKGVKLSEIGAFFERGGTVRPKRARALRIPVTFGGAPALTGAGYDRYAGIPLRSVPGFFPYNAKTGNTFLARADGGLKLWYVLDSQATIHRHPFLEKALDDVEPSIEGMFERTMEQKLD